MFIPPFIYVLTRQIFKNQLNNRQKTLFILMKAACIKLTKILHCIKKITSVFGEGSKNPQEVIHIIKY